ncbi:MAG: phage holin family protein [Candidatus Binataceae bacterium]
MSEDERRVAATPERASAGDWPKLVVRVVDDLARIVQMEFRLFQAGLVPILSSAIDRLVANLMALAAFLAGGVCLLGAMAVCLHRWFGWAPSLAITGAVTITAGYVCARLGRARAEQSMAELEKSFSRASEGDRGDAR